MPTIHVEPGSESLLQEIATTLWKSRKVVVITGAGISTNSGIPDFRSENGLYSLIQAQFDAAAKAPSSDNGDTDESDRSTDFASERPAKRRRVSGEGVESVSSDAPEEPRQDERQCQQSPRAESAVKVELGERAPSPRSIPADAPPRSLQYGDKRVNCEAENNVVMPDATEEEHAPGPPVECRSVSSASKSAPSRNAFTPASSPRLSGRDTEPSRSDVQMSTPTAKRLPFASSPPSLDLGPPDAPIPLRPIDEMGSSPLSSPPPTLLDPYQDYRSRSSSLSPLSSSRGSVSSRSESEESSSASTPLLTSQTSFASTSSRTSLPVLKGKDLFDAQIWSCPVKTSVFYTFATSLRQKVRTAEPTSSHQFVSVLRDSRKLVRCYTQNIDQLEERVGLSTSLELGTGSRYRFSARTGRSLGGAKGTAKDSEVSTPAASQLAGDLDAPSNDSQAEPLAPAQDESASQSQMAPGCADEKEVDTKENAERPASDRGVDDPSADTTAKPSSAAPSTAPAVKGAQAPNRGVECVFLHGSLNELRCFQCGRTSSWDEETRLADTMAGRQPACPHCAGATAARQERGKRALGVGKLRPDIVLYGEEHPHAHLISPIIQHDLSLGPDMLLILGTSMRVHGLKVLVREFAKAVHDRGGKVVFVNFTKPPESVWADVLDFWVQWDCDAWVGDLQQRKPALWLPLGTTLPEDEKVKPVKAPRKSGGGDAAKRRESAKAAALKRRESGLSKKLDEVKDSILVGANEGAGEIAESSQQEVAPSSLTPLRPKSFRVARPQVERKLNPNAKRPASVRDHKQNAAYLSWKIRAELRRITGNTAPASLPSSPAAAEPKPKKTRPRKSAPAVLETLDEPSSQATEQSVGPEQLLVEKRGAMPKEESKTPGITQPPCFRPSLPDNGKVDSIPAPVQPSSSGNGQTGSVSASARPSLPDNGQVDSISAAVKSRKRKRLTWKKINGVETPVAMDEENSQPSANTPTTSAKSALPGPKAVLSLPLLPVRLPKIKSHKAAAGAKKLQPLEPQALSPGPRDPQLPSNVGSPPPMARFRPMSLFQPHNPFGITDPLLRCFGFPPRLEQRPPALEENSWNAEEQRPPEREEHSWNPEEQLRRDQEAALMLSEMRSRRR
ncbi:NAD-dependent histone deacetylase HST3 [Podospora aff. communis PSN243]|uniref:NAD-dependent histone deacetylase HST3 n=1 Tax=Podospora aff. communis PSN243 TaxID=3040156 RepID=A0AAV9GD57_9PEZI|nr:NAD-dependent histone deacetylase HST3 [Podospora aff. communis PSN243]